MPDCAGLADLAVSEPTRAAASRFRNVFRVRGLMRSNTAVRSSGTRATAQSMARAICRGDGCQRAMISRPQESGACQEPHAWLGSYAPAMARTPRVRALQTAGAASWL
jgi:hypothetical protein